jgi:predicted house-cleaning noncanonical NTP pyrophosphatase (MazG superfamily)
MSATDQPYLIKLVRDNVEQSFEHPEHEITYMPIEDRDEMIEWLRRKLGEEAVEYLVKPSLSELADILESLRALASHAHGLGWMAVVHEADRKREARGGFDKGIGMYTMVRR